MQIKQFFSWNLNLRAIKTILGREKFSQDGLEKTEEGHAELIYLH